MKRSSKFGKIIIIAVILMLVLTLGLMYLNALREQNNTYISIDPATVELVQLNEPKEGDPIAIVDTDMGEIRFVLYPEYSPEAVKNFTELAESGYYDGTYFFDCDGGAYAAGGSKKTDGSVDTDDARERIPRTLDQDLWPLRGAVCLVNTSVERGVKEYIFGGGKYYCGSRFEFVNTIEFTDDIKEEMRSAETLEELTEAFISKGGVPNFSQQMTIIGQVYEGLDVVEALSSVESQSNGLYMLPKEEIKIRSVTIGTYAPQEDGDKG
jgi:peptidyl-prolyl cis-trans isomerase B (cyclophilin B)